VIGRISATASANLDFLVLAGMIPVTWLATPPERVPIGSNRDALSILAFAHVLAGKPVSTPDQVGGRHCPGHALTILLAFWLMLAAFPAAAQSADTYPSQAVKVIVPFPPGGVVDLMARILAQKLSVKFAQSFYIENHGGGGGNIGAVMAALAPPDGYTLLITSSAFLLNPLLHAVAYDPVGSFEVISIASTSPVALVVYPGLQARTVDDLVDLVRKEGGATYASAGIGTVNHLAGELFRLSTGLEMTHVPFPGAGPALSSIVGGHTPIAFLALPSVIPFVKDRSVRVLAVTSPTRWSATPEISTLSELGLSGVVAETFVFVLAPKKTPQSIVGEINRAVVEIVQTPEVQERFETLGFNPVGSSPSAAADRLRQELEKWNGVVTKANLKQR
jgi:tripartite-type tricarboxylate transporter receptor subunit TctC